MFHLLYEAMRLTLANLFSHTSAFKNLYLFLFFSSHGDAQ